MGISKKRRLLDVFGEPATIIGRDIEVIGELKGDGHFLICGTVKGDSEVAGPVTLAEGSRWEGSLKASNVIVSGEIDGDLIASDRVEIRPTAKVRGSVTGRGIAIAQGAIIEGEVRTASGGDVDRFVERRHVAD
jgi:cytoskeletal protein CcmA (bactofilin family)